MTELRMKVSLEEVGDTTLLRCAANDLRWFGEKGRTPMRDLSESDLEALRLHPLHGIYQHVTAGEHLEAVQDLIVRWLEMRADGIDRIAREMGTR